MPDIAGNYTPGIVGIALTDSGSATGPLTAEDLLEKGLVNSRYKSIGNQGNVSGTKVVTHNFSAKKFFGKPSSTMINDGTYRGRMGNTGIGSNPSEEAFFEVFVTSINGNNPSSMPFLITIEYIAVLTEPKLEDES